MRLHHMMVAILPLTILAIVTSGLASTTATTIGTKSLEDDSSSTIGNSKPKILSWRNWFGSLYSETEEPDPKLAISRLLIDVPNNNGDDTKRIVENSVINNGINRNHLSEYNASSESMSDHKGMESYKINDLSKQKSHLSPIILIPGDGGSRLEAKLNKKAALHHYCEKKTDWFDLWLNLSLLVPFALDCWVDNMRLIYNSTTRKTDNPEGVDIRVVGFGKTESIEFVDPAKLYGTSYFEALVERLVSLGYERNKNIMGAPYDFRKAPNELNDFFKQLNSLIESTYENNDHEPVILICHSMGCLNALYFLQNKEQSWKDRHVRSIISLSGVWGGSVKAMKAFASGDNFGVIMIPSLSLRKDVRTFPSLAYLLPSGDVWPSDKILMHNDGKSYTVADYKQFFTDINYDIGYEMWKDVHNVTQPSRPPGVEVHCLHGHKINTIEHLEYSKNEFPNGRPTISYSDGDGTVNLISLQACQKWQKLQKAPIYYKNFDDIDHMTILSDKSVMDFIEEAIVKQ